MLVVPASKITSTERRARARSSGLTLMEMMVAVGLTAIAASALLILSSSTGRSLAEMFNYVDLDHVNRVALDNITKELRQVSSLTSFTSNSMSFVEQDGTKLDLVYTPASRTLDRIRNGQARTLLTQCDDLSFAIYQRTPVSNRFDLIPVTTPTQCKVVTLTWSCSRTLFGRRANTEQGQSAKVVLRNK